tara:strand:+ start:10045 stop:10362 length:318 start_codon:yes stop_codon:yes gene_type:complete
MITITEEDYKFVENADFSNHHCVELLSSMWKGTIYVYGEVKAVVENTEEGLARLDFTYQILENPTGMDLDNNPAFGNHIGEILQHIVADAFESGNYRVGDEEKTN